MSIYYNVFLSVYQAFKGGKVTKVFLILWRFKNVEFIQMKIVFKN